jgi:hypothetical protein
MAFDHPERPSRTATRRLMDRPILTDNGGSMTVGRVQFGPYSVEYRPLASPAEGAKDLALDDLIREIEDWTAVDRRALIVRLKMIRQMRA